MKKNNGEERAIFLLKVARRALEDCPQNFELSRCYTKKLVALAESRQMRMTCDLRAMICRKCKLLLLPNISSKIRLRSKFNNVLKFFTLLNIAENR